MSVVACSGAPEPRNDKRQVLPSAPETASATVTAELPQRLFRLQISDGTVVIAGPSEELVRLARPIRKGTRVVVRRARLDPGRGTIIALVEP